MTRESWQGLTFTVRELEDEHPRRNDALLRFTAIDGPRSASLVVDVRAFEEDTTDPGEHLRRIGGVFAHLAAVARANVDG